MTTLNIPNTGKTATFSINIPDWQLKWLNAHSIRKGENTHYTGGYFNLSANVTIAYRDYMKTMTYNACEFIRIAISEFIQRYDENDGLLGIDDHFAISRAELLRLIIRDAFIRRVKYLKSLVKPAIPNTISTDVWEQKAQQQ